MANLDAVARTLRRNQDRQVVKAGACVITTPGSGEGVVDGDGNYTPPPASARYEGPCWVSPSTRATSTREVNVSGTQVNIHLYDVKVLLDCDAAKDDVVTITESRDHLLVDAHLVVREVVNREHLTGRVLVCEESR
jgi:hypothetical protein